MKKIIFLAAVISVLASCITPPPKKKEKVDREIGIELKKFIEECIELVPNAGNNTIAKKRLQDTITARMEKRIGDTLDFMSNYPMRIKKYDECIPGITGRIGSKIKEKGKYLVIFRSSFSKNMVVDLPNFQVITIMERDSVEKLVDDGEYKIQGIFKGFVKDFYLPHDCQYFTDPPSISRISKYSYDMTLGTMILENIRIEPFIEEKQ